MRSEKSFGVGEFADLKLLADWGKQVGLKLIQLLPVNDTSATHTWKDSYPYAAISAFALHPIYLNLAAVANAKNKKLLQALEPERQRLNALETVDYEAVMSAKLGFLKTIFPSQKAATFRTREYKAFFAENRALARALRRVLFFARQIRHAGFQPVAGTQRIRCRPKSPRWSMATTKSHSTFSFSIICICNSGARRRMCIPPDSF